MTMLGAGGEEWRRMEKEGVYRPDDAALAASKQSIQKIRMRDVTLRLVDRAGRAVANAPIEVVQEEHAFPFGENLWMLDTLYRTGMWDHDRGRYFRLRLREVFNTVNALCYWTERPRNDGPKTEDIQGEPKYEGFARCVEWARGEGMQVKGHPLFWSIPKCVPEWVKRYDYETQMKFVEVRIRTLVSRFRGKVGTWDVVNEALWEPAFKHLPMRDWPHLETTQNMADYIEPVIRWARDEDPEALFVLNDYGLEGGGFKTPPVAKDGTEVTAELQRKRMLELVAELGKRGCAPGAIGLQSHTGGFLDKATEVELFDQMAASGLPVQITEFWTPKIGRDDMPAEEKDEILGQYACDFLTHAFGHPAVEAFFFWGFMSRAIRWDENPAKSGHELKPMFHRVKQLINEEWTTRHELRTDGEGVVRFRGYFGRHALRYALPGGGLDGVRFEVSREAGETLTVRLPLANLVE